MFWIKLIKLNELQGLLGRFFPVSQRHQSLPGVHGHVHDDVHSRGLWLRLWVESSRLLDIPKEVIANIGFPEQPENRAH